MRVIKTIIYILITLLTMACHKDKPIPAFEETSDCKGFSKNLPMTTYFTNDRVQYKAPHFNPNNSDEFVYHFRDYEQNKFQLVKYSIQTQQRTIIAESGEIYRQPKWSRNGWIAYTHRVNYVDHIYIVKENGDSLIQYTENVSNMYPAWSSMGSVLYWMHTPNLGVPYYFLKQKINTLTFDTLSKYGDAHNGYIRYNTISKSNHLLSLALINNNPHIAVASLDEEIFSFSSIANMNQVFDYPIVSGLCWSHDEEYVYATIGFQDNGLYKIGVNTSSCELLISFCDTKRYESISASSDGKYLVGERVDSYLQLDGESNPTGEIVENSSIYLINLQTLEETKIDLSP
jgi:hypothetical protein